MSAFELVVTLLSFVFALALAHLLTRAGEMIVARRRVRMSGLLVLAMVNAALLVYENWLSLWDLRATTSWDIGSITAQFLTAVSQYLICVVVGPRLPEEGTLDMEAFYSDQRLFIWGLFLATVALAMLANATFLKTPNAALFLEQNGLDLLFVPPIALALAVRARWAQWAGGLAVLALNLSFMVMFESVLGR